MPPDHMKGINSLPRWDPNNLAAGYRYERGSYSHEDYRLFKEARQQADQKSLATAKRELKRVMKDAGRAIAEKVISAFPRNSTMTIDTPSTCFASVTWEPVDGEDGICTGTFHRGGKLVYDGPMTLDEFLDFADAESLGSWYAANKPF